jgi:hypothetical protein
MKFDARRLQAITTLIVSSLSLYAGFALLQDENSFLRTISYIALFWGFSGLIYGFALLVDMFLKS